MQSGGDPQAYQEVKQLIELMFDVEQQLVRNDQVGTQYGGQTGTAGGATGNSQTGRRMGSLSSFAGTQSFNTTAGSGTTGIAALQEGSDFIGIDMNQHYIDIAERRIKDHCADPAYKLFFYEKTGTEDEG